MTPDQLAAVNAVATILERMGTWPIGTIIAVCVLGPWISLIFLERSRSRAIDARQEEERKRFDSVVEMYKNNVALVEHYQGIAKDQHETIVYNTTVMTQVKELATNNLWCPLARKGTKQTDIHA
jgi:hypothetical protein